jgi:hypothetical protein
MRQIEQKEREREKRSASVSVLCCNKVKTEIRKEQNSKRKRSLSAYYYDEKNSVFVCIDIMKKDRKKII